MVPFAEQEAVPPRQRLAAWLRPGSCSPVRSSSRKRSRSWRAATAVVSRSAGRSCTRLALRGARSLQQTARSRRAATPTCRRRPRERRNGAASSRSRLWSGRRGAAPTSSAALRRLRGKPRRHSPQLSASSVSGASLRLPPSSSGASAQMASASSPRCASRRRSARPRSARLRTSRLWTASASAPTRRWSRNVRSLRGSMRCSLRRRTGGASSPPTCGCRPQRPSPLQRRRSETSRWLRQRIGPSVPSPRPHPR
mmetsp:Transcript_87236/g.177826  ORF Transcript_87236/g.177826 Transcript_87236/m.177826 type:complete len:254 (-) Transcript_87236:825-1586(-)